MNRFISHSRALIPLFLLIIIGWSGLLVGEPFDPRVVYLTWLRQPDTTMTVQWMTEGDQDPHDDVAYQEIAPETQGWHMQMGRHFPFPGRSGTLLHRVELTQLKSDTDYRFKIGINGKEYKFRTMPTTPTSPVRFVVGGDMYHDTLENVVETNRMAAKFDPAFALAGATSPNGWTRFGSKQRSIERWITWLQAWKESMVTPDGRMIPLLAAIGNHDTDGGFNQTPAQAPIFYLLFRAEGQPGYEVMDFGSYLSVFILDTAHTTPIEAQVQWLTRVLGERESVIHKIALYHVPAYPSYRDFNNTVSKDVRKYWVPLFEKFHLDVAFEHHDHTYKRTLPLLQGLPDPAGVLYMGDGAWGVNRPRTPRKRAPYLAYASPTRHFIGVTLQSRSRSMQAISSQGVVFDEIQQVVK